MARHLGHQPATAVPSTVVTEQGNGSLPRPPFPRPSLRSTHHAYAVETAAQAAERGEGLPVPPTPLSLSLSLSQAAAPAGRSPARFFPLCSATRFRSRFLGPAPPVPGVQCIFIPFDSKKSHKATGPSSNLFFDHFNWRVLESWSKGCAQHFSGKIVYTNISGKVSVFYSPPPGRRFFAEKVTPRFLVAVSLRPTDRTDCRWARELDGAGVKRRR